MSRTSILALNTGMPITGCGWSVAPKSWGKILLLAWATFTWQAAAESPADPNAAAATATAAAAKTIQITEIQRSTPVDFEKEILPILRNNCLACHNRTKAKADLVLETPADILKGGESGPAAVPKKGADSLMVKVAAHQTKPMMPPKDNKVEAQDLAPEQLGLLKLWIDQGAEGEVRGNRMVQWEPLPAGVHPIYSVAMTEDGQLAACGRANQLSIYALPTQELVARLTDPQLLKSGLYGKQGVAHRDMVNALAFSPDTQWLASGDYRTIKLWQKSAQLSALEFRSADFKPTTTFTIAPQQKWLVTGHADGSLALWKWEASAPLAHWAGHSHGIQKLRTSPDGNRVASVSGSQRIGIWSLPEGRNLLWLQSSSPVTALTWAQGGQRLVAGGADGRLRAWDTSHAGETNAVLIKEWNAHTGTVSSLDATPQKPGWLLSGGTDGWVELWDLEKAEEIRRWNQNAAVSSIALRSDGKRLASGGSNAVVRIWNSENTNLVAELRGNRVREGAVLQAEREVSLARGDIAYLKGVLEEAKKREKVESDFAAKAMDNRVAAEKALSEKQKAVLAAVEARAAAERTGGELAAELQKVADQRDALEAAAVAAESARAASQKHVDDLKAHAQTIRQSIEKMGQVPEAEAGKVAGLSEAKQAARDLVGVTDKLAEEAKRIAERVASEVPAKRKAADDAKAEVEKKSAEVAEKRKQLPEKIAAAAKAVEAAEKEADVALVTKKSSEDQLAANQRAAKKASALVPETQTLLQTAETSLQQREAALLAAKKFAAEAQSVPLAIQFSQDQTLCAVGSVMSEIQTWSAETGSAGELFPATGGGCLELAFGPDRRVFELGTNGIVQTLLRSETWALAKTLGGEDATSPLQGRVNALRFSPDGKLLAAGSGEPSRGGEITFWDVAHGTLVRTLTNAHSDVVLGLDFSRDGKHLASGGSDRFVKVWEVESGKMVRSFEGHTHHVLGVSWKPDGRTLASAGADKVIKLWNFVTGEQKKTIGGSEKEVTSIGYVQATGEALVTSGDAQVRFVAEDGKVARAFGSATDFMQSAAVTPDGKWVVGGGQDGILRYWNGANGQLLKTFDADQIPSVH